MKFIIITLILSGILYSNEINYQIPTIGQLEKIQFINDSNICYYGGINMIISNSKNEIKNIFTDRTNYLSNVLKISKDTAFIGSFKNKKLIFSINQINTNNEFSSVNLNIDEDSIKFLQITNNTKFLIVSFKDKISIFNINSLLLNNIMPVIELNSFVPKNYSTDFGDNIFYVDDKKNFNIMNLKSLTKKAIDLPKYNFSENDTYLFSNNSKYLIVFNLNEYRNYLYSFEKSSFIDKVLPGNHEFNNNIKFSNDDKYLFYLGNKLILINMLDFTKKEIIDSNKYFFSQQNIIDVEVSNDNKNIYLLKDNSIEMYDFKTLNKYPNDIIFPKTNKILNPNNSDYIYTFSSNNNLGLTIYSSKTGNYLKSDTLNYMRKVFKSNTDYLFFNYKYLYINDYRNHITLDSIQLDSDYFNKLSDADIQNDILIVNYYIQNEFKTSLYRISNKSLILDKIAGYSKFTNTNTIINRVPNGANYQINTISTIDFKTISNYLINNLLFYTSNDSKFLFEFISKDSLIKYDLKSGTIIKTFHLNDTISTKGHFYTFDNLDYFIEINPESGNISFRNFINFNIDLSYDFNKQIRTILKPNVLYDKINKSLVIQFDNGLIVSLKLPYFLEVIKNEVKNSFNNIYPNPIKSGNILKINLQSVENKILTTNIYNNNGELVCSNIETFNNSENSIEIIIPESFLNGLYYITVESGSNCLYRNKFIINN